MLELEIVVNKELQVLLVEPKGNHEVAIKRWLYDNFDFEICYKRAVNFSDENPPSLPQLHEAICRQIAEDMGSNIFKVLYNYDYIFSKGEE